MSLIIPQIYSLLDCYFYFKVYHICLIRAFLFCLWRSFWRILNISNWNYSTPPKNSVSTTLASSFTAHSSICSLKPANNAAAPLFRFSSSIYRFHYHWISMAITYQSSANCYPVFGTFSSALCSRVTCLYPQPRAPASTWKIEYWPFYTGLLLGANSILNLWACLGNRVRTVPAYRLIFSGTLPFCMHFHSHFSRLK